MLSYQEAGQGPVLFLLHGFPDTSRVWKQQIQSLSQSFRVIAPDLRGYGQSPRPKGISAYQVGQLVQDIVDLQLHLGVAGIRLCGHDWGGSLAWSLAARRPDLIERLAVLNCPHPDALFRQLLTNPRQTLRSWYMFFFQLPWLPEQILLQNTKKWLRWLHHGDRHFDPDYIADTAEALAQPGAMTAALNYYRAFMRRSSPKLPKITTPSLLIWGTRDQALGKQSALASAAYLSCPLQLHLWPDAGHWSQLDQPERTSQTLARFFLE